MEVPDSDVTYYVVDQVKALQGRISESLADVWLNDSDISIRFGIFGDEFAHLRLAPDETEVLYFRFEDALPIQVRAFFEEGGFATGTRFVEFHEYGIFSGLCPELDASIGSMQSTLRNSMSNIGRPSELEGISVDGAYYELTVKMERILIAQIGVGPNAGSLFEVVHSFSGALDRCRVRLEPQVRVSDF